MIERKKRARVPHQEVGGFARGRFDKNEKAGISALSNPAYT